MMTTERPKGSSKDRLVGEFEDVRLPILRQAILSVGFNPNLYPNRKTYRKNLWAEAIYMEVCRGEVSRG